MRRARVGVTAAFAAHAVLSGLLGPWIPHIKAQAGLDASGLGIALTGFAVGLLAGTRVADPAIRRWGGRRIVRGGIPAMGVGFALLPAAREPRVAHPALPRHRPAGGPDRRRDEHRGGRRRASVRTPGDVGDPRHVERGVVRRRRARLRGDRRRRADRDPPPDLGRAGRRGERRVPPVVAGREGSAGGERQPGRPDDANVPRASSTRVLLLLCLVAGGSFLVEGIAVEWSAVFLRESVGADRERRRSRRRGVLGGDGGVALRRRSPRRTVRTTGRRSGRRLERVRGARRDADRPSSDPVRRRARDRRPGPRPGGSPRVPDRPAGPYRRGHASALPLVVTAGYAGSIVGPLLVGFIADLATLRIAFLVPVVACAVSALAAGATRDP